MSRETTGCGKERPFITIALPACNREHCTRVAVENETTTRQQAKSRPANLLRPTGNYPTDKALAINDLKLTANSIDGPRTVVHGAYIADSNVSSQA